MANSNIYNNSKSNIVNQAVYDSFNSFIFSSDIKVLGKMLHRFDFFNQVRHMPGDIVEVGVFKGSGVATFSKFLEIYAPNSIKKVIGFDLFNAKSDVFDNYERGDSMKLVYNRIDENDLSVEAILTRLENIKQDRFELVKGDVCETTAQYSADNPGMRISLLYMDLDLAEPTYHTLKNLWKHVIPGGIIVFDEYQYHIFDECNGVDKFLREEGIDYEIISTNWLAPDAYIIKK